MKVGFKIINSFLKRIFDFIAAIFGLIITSPFFLIIVFLIKLEDGGPIFYRGVRAGRFSQPFQIFKFRSMVINAEKIGGPSTSSDDPRLTKIGKFLRRYKLDEIPQLINVAKGEMSFVGPRPEVREEVALYNEEEKKILEVRPGITDYASIKFSNEGEILKGSLDPHKTYQEKIKPEKHRLALEYVENNSLWIDLKIILKTVLILFKG